MSTSQSNPTTTTTSTHATSGEATDAQAGNAVKSAYNAVHGGLEKLRGETLSAADAAGDAISNRPAESAAHRTDSGAAVAQKGDAEMNQGVAGLSSYQSNRASELHPPAGHNGGVQHTCPLPVPPTETAPYRTPVLASGSESQFFPPPPTHPSAASSSLQTHSSHHAPPLPRRPEDSSVTSRPAASGVDYPAIPARTVPEPVHTQPASDNVINNSFNDGRTVPGQTGKTLAESGFGRLKTVLQSANGTIENLRKQSLAVADSAGEAIAQRKADNQSSKKPTL